LGPEPASYDPEEFVDGSQPWPRLLALKDGELLAKGEIFEHQTAARPKPAKHGSEPEPKQVKHGNQVIADRLCRPPCEVVDFTAGQDCDEGQILRQYGAATVWGSIDPSTRRNSQGFCWSSAQAQHSISRGKAPFNSPLLMVTRWPQWGDGDDGSLHSACSSEATEVGLFPEVKGRIIAKRWDKMEIPVKWSARTISHFMP